MPYTAPSLSELKNFIAGIEEQYNKQHPGEKKNEARTAVIQFIKKMNSLLEEQDHISDSDKQQILMGLLIAIRAGIYSEYRVFSPTFWSTVSLGFIGSSLYPLIEQHGLKINAVNELKGSDHVYLIYLSKLYHFLAVNNINQDGEPDSTPATCLAHKIHPCLKQAYEEQKQEITTLSQPKMNADLFLQLLTAQLETTTSSDAKETLRKLIKDVNELSACSPPEPTATTPPTTLFSTASNATFGRIAVLGYEKSGVNIGAKIGEAIGSSAGGPIGSLIGRNAGAILESPVQAIIAYLAGSMGTNALSSALSPTTSENKEKIPAAKIDSEWAREVIKLPADIFNPDENAKFKRAVAIPTTPGANLKLHPVMMVKIDVTGDDETPVNLTIEPVRMCRR